MSKNKAGPITMTKYKISYSFQLRKHDFKTKKYGQFSIINKCLSDWNQLQKHLKTNFKNIKCSELKTIVTNLLEQYITYWHSKITKEWLRKSVSTIPLYLLDLYLSLKIYLSLSSMITISYFFPPVPGISILKFSGLTWLSSPTTSTYYI